MDRQAAVKIIKDTFESSFDKGQFINLSKNLVKYLDDSKNFTYQGNIIPDAYEQSIQTLERVGKYEDADNNKIDVLIVQLRKEHSLERARTMQRNFVAWYLNGSRGGELKDAALVAFVSPDDRDWRFSLVRMDYNLVESPTGRVKVEKELTPARRYSFLVGESESSHTAQVQLLPILENDERKPLLSDFEKAFSIEVVTREFFTRYRELFHKVEEALQKLVEQDKKIREDFEAKGVDTVNFAKKLLGQVVFLYFLQKKGWFGVGRDEDWGTGPKDFLRRLFEKKIVPYGNFFNDVLEPLFYEALAVERTDDFYSHFNCKIPFLNGGLFDPINNYDWVHTDILLSNELFSNTDRTKEGDVGAGILDVFDRYNFTVKEDEPLDKEVAVDPEMLGRVFENLLEVKDRKSKGTYYTPREIVHYMCQESLINYLDTAINNGEVPLVTEKPTNLKLFGAPAFQQQALKTLGNTNRVPREDIEAFVRMGELAIEHDTRVETYGKETERYSYKLPESVRHNAKLIDGKLASIRACDPAIGSGAFPVGLMTEIVRARNTLTTYLANEKDRTNYNFKRRAIQNCLYGVDIDPGAVEIAKLRLWLSLVVDEEDIKQIQPLPNLDYKIVCGNSLVGVERNMFNNELFQKLEVLKPPYFDETNAKKKQEFRKQIDQLIMNLTNNKETFDFEVYFSEVFHENGGFDV
ncbi:MAG: DNA methyltransferase, partial [Acidobacteriota bacterium]|nr:DNA methyltransferase [Acidobacteriota bacterium]